jgi:hypothetical protein
VSARQDSPITINRIFRIGDAVGGVIQAFSNYFSGER